jgi:hypothetical protein
MEKFIGNGWTLDAGQVTLKRLGDDRPAGLWITSLPWPRMAAAPLSLNGAATYGRPLGQWPGSAEGTPRRMLLVADGGNRAPDQLTLADIPAAAAPELPAAEFESFARSPDPYFAWERHRLRIRYQGRSLAIAMGLRTGTEWRWWEACGMVVREETPTCRVVEMSGAIPLVHSRKFGGANGHYRNPWLHKHHWLYGQVQVRLHANGVCEVFARHINSKYVDEGGDLKPAVPTIGFWSGEGDAVLPAGLQQGVWDGSCDSFSIGDAAFDVTDVARLASPEQPGRMDAVEGAVVWQPYQGCELFGGVCANERCGGGYILRSEEETILRGMARTLRFSFSLSDRSPRVARYLAPDWWYGLCEEFTPGPLLPVYSGAEAHLDSARAWVRVAHVARGFEEGAVARGGRLSGTDSRERLEPGWEGEIPYAQFLAAWRYGDAGDYDLAMRSAYHFADVIIDHAANLVRMHGYPPIAFALPMNRVQGPLAAFLETGDDFLFDCAEKVVEAANRLHRNAWPRMAVGRDACYLRSAVLLYRYTGNPHFRRIAYEGLLTVAQSQRPNGSFGDQGGGTGIHQWGGYITKPWMGLLAINGVIDYLEHIGDEPAFVACVRRFADWLMAERSDRDGVLSWGYQHDSGGTRQHQQHEGGTVEDLPSKPRWHQDNLARLMGYCAMRDNRADYLDAWAESFGAVGEAGGDHGTSASLQFLPWVQAALWRSTLGVDGELNVSATRFGPRTFAGATVHTPDGPRTLAWQKNGQITADLAIKITTRVLPDVKRV